MPTHADRLAQFFDAIHRSDFAAVAGFLDPQVVRTEPEGFPTSGTYRGRATVVAHVQQGRSTWAEGACTPERFLVRGDHAVVFLHAHVRLHGATEWIDGRFADGFVLRNGLIVDYHSFGQRADALRWAGIDPAEAAA